MTKTNALSKKTTPEKARSSTTKSRIVPANAARKARVLLDVISEAGNIAYVLEDVLARLGKDKPGIIVSRIKAAQEAAVNVMEQGRANISNVSKAPFVLKAYDALEAAKAKERAEMGEQEKSPILKLRAFNHSCKKGRVMSSTIGVQSTKKSKSEGGNKIWHSPRTNKQPVVQLEDNFTGLPPKGKTKWSQADIIKALIPCTGALRKDRITKILKMGKFHYRSDSGIYLLLKKYRNGQDPRLRGRPRQVSIANLANIANANARAMSGRAVKLSAIKAGATDAKRKEAETAGISSNFRNSKVSDYAAKVTAVAAAMLDGFGLGLSNKKLQTKTESRFIASNSIMATMAYCMTVLATHFLAGTAPHYSKYDPSHLSQNAVETLEMVSDAYGVDSVYPVDPNLVISVDDTTVFACNAINDGSNWDWKFLSPEEDGGHLSDYEVGSDADCSGGLRARLTFAETATGLLAQTYVAISGLTTKELPMETCPDRILAMEIPGLCKGGSNNLFSEGGGWLVLLRADKPKNEEAKQEIALSIAKKNLCTTTRMCFCLSSIRFTKNLDGKRDRMFPLT